MSFTMTCTCLSHQIGAGQAAHLRQLDWRHGELADENGHLKTELQVQAEQDARLCQKLIAEQAQSAHLNPLLKCIREFSFDERSRVFMEWPAGKRLLSRRAGLKWP